MKRKFKELQHHRRLFEEFEVVVGECGGSIAIDDSMIEAP